MSGVLGLAGCKPDLPPGFDLAAAKAFQREHDAEIGAAVSPLTAVRAHYLANGQSLELGSTALRVDGRGFVCERGCGDQPVLIEGRREVQLGGKRLVLSPQSGGGRVLEHDPAAPARAGFSGVPWFPASAAYIVPARVDREQEPPPVQLTTTRGLAKTLHRIGAFEFQLGGRAQRLDGFGDRSAQGPILIPFVDRTGGVTTYPVGRYLTVELAAGQTVVALDFNRATNPWCAYSEHYNCPIPPPQNRLDLEVEAGERYEADGAGEAHPPAL